MDSKSIALCRAEMTTRTRTTTTNISSVYHHSKQQHVSSLLLFCSSSLPNPSVCVCCCQKLLAKNKRAHTQPPLPAVTNVAASVARLFLSLKMEKPAQPVIFAILSFSRSCFEGSSSLPGSARRLGVRISQASYSPSCLIWTDNPVSHQ